MYDYKVDSTIGKFGTADQMEPTSYVFSNQIDNDDNRRLVADLISDRNALIRRNAALREMLESVTKDRDAFALALARKVSQ